MTCPSVLMCLSVLQGYPLSLHPNSWPQCLREPELLGLCWYGWEQSPPSSSSSPGSAASAASRVLPAALSRAIGVEQPRGAAKGSGSAGQGPRRCCLPPGSITVCFLGLLWVSPVPTLARGCC